MRYFTQIFDTGLLLIILIILIIQDYKSMISFVDSLPDNSAKSHQHIQYLYAFALERLPST